MLGQVGPNTWIISGSPIGVSTARLDAPKGATVVDISTGTSYQKVGGYGDNSQFVTATVVPKFRVHTVVNQTLTRNGTVDTLAFGAEDLDTAGGFASNAYTIPTGYGGQWQFGASILLTGGGASDELDLRIYVAENEVSRIACTPMVTAGTYCLTGTDRITVVAGDVITLRMRQVGANAAWVVYGGAGGLTQLSYWYGHQIP